LEIKQQEMLDDLRVSYELKMVQQESCLTEKLHAERESLIAERLNVETSLQVVLRSIFQESFAKISSLKIESFRNVATIIKILAKIVISKY